jgi:hypothetical protein
MVALPQVVISSPKLNGKPLPLPSTITITASLAVQPALLVTVTLYVPLSFTVMDCQVAPVFQAYMKHNPNPAPMRRAAASVYILAQAERKTATTAINYNNYRIACRAARAVGNGYAICTAFASRLSIAK